MVMEDLRNRANRCLGRTVLDTVVRGAYSYWLKLLLKHDPVDARWVDHATRNTVEHSTDPATSRRIAANALAFWFHCIAEAEPRWFPDWSKVFRPQPPKTLASDEQGQLLAQMCGLPLVACQIMTCTGLKPAEVLALRVRDVCLAERVLSVTGLADMPARVLHVPWELCGPLRELICEVRKLHQWDCDRGGGWAPVPPDWELTRPRAGKEFAFQFLFPQCVRHTESLTRESQRRPLSESHLRTAVREAGRRACVGSDISIYSLRHTYARSLAASGWSVSRLQAHLGQSWTLDTLGYFQE